MSRLGKSLKNRFLRRALAMVLAGTMVMTGMPVSFAEESTETEASVETEVQSETEKIVEESAEDGEVTQKESEETASQEKESTKPDEESETVSVKESTTAKEDKETTSADSNDSTVSSEIEETETLETDTEEVTETEGTEEENEAQTSTYSVTEGNSEALVKYNIEGFADSYGVTGGGLLKKGENDNYYVADSEEAFLKAVLAARNAKNHAPVVIEITKDMNLGDIELGETLLETYSRVIAKDAKNPLMHPTLLKTGVTILTLQDTENLTIFSKNGSSIKHCGIVVKRVKNLIIRNITFDELWEWDENTSGAYDRNDWDYIGIQDSDGIWIDHCTFYKAYDGIIDVKYSDGTVQMDSNVTISWCRFLPGSKNDTFFDAMMDELKLNKSNTTYYKKLIDTDGLTEDQIRNYAYGQKKTHLIGQDDDYENTKNINVTLANNYYFDSMDRMPRVRWATAHEYNCVLDAQQLYDWRNEKNENDKTIGGKITSNGALSTCEGKVLLENCYIKGINNPLISGNDKSSPGAINAIHSLYYMDSTDKTSELNPKNNNSSSYTGSGEVLTTNAKEFIGALPYKTNYQKYGADTLNTDAADSIKSLAGAGKLTDLSEVQWQKTSYGSRTITDPNPGGSETDPPETEPSEPSTDDEEMTIAFELNANDMTLETLSDKKSAGTADKFTIEATADRYVTVSAYNGNPIEGKEFTKRIQLEGTGAEDYRSIHFTADKSGVLTVYAQSSGTARNLELYKGSEKKGSKQAPAKDANAGMVLEYPITEVGKYNIRAAGGGINIYYIAYSVKKTSEGETDKNPPTGYEDSPILNANDLEAEKITKEIKLNNHYTVKGTSDGAVTIKELGENGKITVNEKEFAKAISLVGSGSADKSAIAITVPKAGKLIVYASRTPVLENGSNEQQAGTTTQNVTEYTIDGEGTYFLYASENDSDIYYIEFTEQTQDPSGNKIKETLEFRVNAQTTGKLAQDLKVNDYFTIKTASEASGNEIKEETETIKIGGKDFTKYVKLNGGAKKEDKSIKIYALGSGTLTIYAKSSNETAARTVNLLDSDGKPISGQSHEGVSTAISFTLQIPEKGIYYVGSASSGLFIYGIDFEVTYEKGETLPIDPDDQEKPETDPPIFAEVAPADGNAFGADEGKAADKIAYNIEGYAASANVTGGGLLKEDSANYYVVTNEKEFIDALNSVRSLGTEGGLKPQAEIQPAVIEIQNDLNLGEEELLKQGIDITQNPAKTVMQTLKNSDSTKDKSPLMHPTLKTTGVSVIKLNYFHNLTIYSKNGAAIKHAGIRFEGDSSNIIIRNITFDEFWEWDEATTGDYDRNDWDYIAVGEQTDGLWIDHCTFYKAYDGMLDIQGDKDKKIINQRVTISWCEFLPGSKNNTFFNEQMTWLEEHKDDTTYYKQLRQSMSPQEVWWYAYGQKKAMLFGPNDKADYASAIRATIANSHYKNIMDRMPRLRFGKVHEYNCVLDGQNLYTKKTSGSSGLSGHITSQGAISACGGEMLLENCYIRGILHPLYSGNGDSPRGKINAEQSIYYMNGSLQGDVKIEKSGADTNPDPLKTDSTAFKKALPYTDYITYDATQLYTKVVPYAGAGKLDMTTVQWERTNYAERTGNESSTTSSSPSQSEPEGPNDELPKTPWDDPENPDDPVTVDAPIASPANEAEFLSTGGEVTLNCTTEGATIYYTISETEAGLTDPADKTNANRVPYVTGTKISIKTETYIWAVAVKDEKTSGPLKCHYTVAAEGAVLKPFANPNPSIPVASGTKVTLSTMGEFDVIYYTKGATPDATADPREENSGREPYNNETGIVITEAVTIKAAAKKGDAYSEIVTFTYTISTDDPEENDRVKAPVASPAAGAVKIGTTVRLSSATLDAKIYYTTDGTTEPTIDSKLYTEAEPITITAAMTIKAFAVKEGLKDSAVVTFAYTIAQDPDDPNPPITPIDPDDPGVDKTDIWITGLEAEYFYTGAKIIPDIKVWDCDIKGNDRLLVPGVDYTAAYKNNSKVSTGSVKAEVIITGKGNYAGKGVTEKFSIVPAKGVENPINVKGAKIEKIKDQEYDNGEAIYPNFNLTLKGKSAVTYTYNNGSYARADGEPMDINVAVSNNVNQGKAAILVTGAQEKGKTTSVKAAFKITPIDLSKVTLDVEAEPAAYAVKGAIPVLTVKYDGKTLVNGRDYVAKYGNNKKAGGKGSVTISGKGNYAKNARSVLYDVKQLDMSELSVSAATVYDKVKAGRIKATVLDKDGNELKPAQYTLEVYKEDGSKYGANDELKAGEAVSIAAVAKDKVNLTGSTPKTDFKVGKDISKAKFKLKKSVKKSYTGDEVTLIATDFEPVTLKGVTGNLEMGRDFEIVAYSNNINKGNATAIIRGIGNYSGTKTIKFKITPQTMVKGKTAD